MRKLITLLLLVNVAYGQVYQSMPQYGYGPIQRMQWDSVMTIPLGITSLRQSSSFRNVGQLRFNQSDSSIYVWSGFQWIRSSGGSNIIAGNQLVRSGDTLGLRSSSPGVSNALWFNPNLGSFAAGFNNVASGINSVALGSSKASGSYSAAIGDNVQNPNNASLVIGDNNDPTNNVSNDVVFQAARNNVNRFEVRGNGQLLINDGTQQSGYVLTSDANGVTSWQAPASGADSTIFATQFRLDTVKANRVIIGSDAELRSLHITGTNGNGKLDLRHQASLPTATGQTTALYANSAGNLAWKNDNLHHTTLATNHITADRSYRFQDKSYTLADSADVALKLNITDTANIRPRLSAGANITLAGSYPNITISAAGGSGGWGLTGNASTDSNANFIGTTDNRRFVVRTNNTERVVFGTSYNSRFNVTASNAFTLQPYFGGVGMYLHPISSPPAANSNGNGALLLAQGNDIDLRAPTGTGSVGISAGASAIAQLNTARVSFVRQLIVSGSHNDIINPSSEFEIRSTTRGFLPPRMTTTQRDAIASPAAGLIIYNTTTNKHQGYNGTTWNDFY